MERVILTTKEADEILRYMKRMPAAEWTVRPDQTEKIKYLWRMLHEYDQEHEYTFNESFTKIRKELR